LNDSTADNSPEPQARNTSYDKSAGSNVPTEFTSRRLVAIQILRGIAALMVVFHHALHQSEGFLSLWPTEAGQAGVDLFFVISGFVMVYVTREREQSARQFIVMRAIRIVPIYWFYTLAAAFLMAVLPRLFRSNELTVSHVLLSLLFIPHDSQGSYSPVVKQGWTLNYEVFFYVVFAIAMAISVRRRVISTTVTLTAIASLGYLLQAANPPIGILWFYLNGMLLEFSFGMLIAVAYFNGYLKRLNFKFGITLIAIGFIALFALDPLQTPNSRPLIYGAPAVVIVIGALACEKRQVRLRSRFFEFTGDSSYSIYLVHIFPIAVMRAIWPHIMPMRGWLSFSLFLAISVAFVLIIAGVSYRIIEIKSLKYLRGKYVR